MKSTGRHNSKIAVVGSLEKAWLEMAETEVLTH